MSDLDVARLGQWLAGVLPAAPADIRLEKFPGGQSNPTYRMTIDGRDYVLRRRPFGPLLPSAHAVEREYRLISALHPTGFPVPAPLAVCQDDAVIGSAFYV
ncbi:phosphotransferase, partial [Brevundimonas sp.]|uniref:phosphotransferase n=2 Tax=Brevundimonas TaxID=41275 RepID=UPI0028B01B50